MDQQALYDARLELADFLVAALADVPDETFVEGLVDGDVRVPDGEVNEPLDRGFEALEDFRAAVADREPAAIQDDLEREFTRLFVGPRPRILAHETYYREDTDFRGKGLAEVEASYAGAGWAPPDDYPEESDYVAVQLAFLRHLIGEQRAGREEAVGFQRVFHEEHLSAWIDDLAAAVRDETDERFYEAVGWLLEGFVAFEEEIARQVA